MSLSDARFCVHPINVYIVLLIDVYKIKYFLNKLSKYH